MFEKYWSFINKRGVSSIQNREELEHIFYLIQGCESYLEVGTAEGNSLYVLTHALKPNAHITYIDWDEKHTRPQRQEVLNILNEEGYVITSIHANTLHREAIEKAQEKRYDVVLIDAGHSFDEVMADAINYGKLANKFLVFHDVMLPEVRQAFDKYVKENNLKAEIFTRSDNFGFGIIRK